METIVRDQMQLPPLDFTDPMQYGKGRVPFDFDCAFGLFQELIVRQVLQVHVCSISLDF